MFQNLRDFLWMFLLPLSIVWAGIMNLRRRLFSRGYKSRLPVLCIGNIHVGGSGKTPVVYELFHLLSDLSPVILSRGYRGKLEGAVSKVDPLVKEGALLYGDEPWMLQKKLGCSIYVGKKRALVARFIETTVKTGIILMDDGFQNLSLKKDCSIIVINTGNHIESSFCLPLGDLREGLMSLHHCEGILLIGDRESKSFLQWESLIKSLTDKPVFFAKTKAEIVCLGVKAESSQKAVAFCGIAKPERFFDSLSALGLEFEKLTFPDHHRYGTDDIDKILAFKKMVRAERLITTEKDWVKVGDQFAERQEEVSLVSLRVELSDSLISFIRGKLKGAA